MTSTEQDDAARDAAVETTATQPQPDGHPELPPKDAEEIALEKLVFGDFTGFQHGLAQVDDLFSYSSHDDGLSGLDADHDTDPSDDDPHDDDLFFIDESAGSALHIDLDLSSHTDDDNDDTDTDNAAWIDSDDDRVSVSLTASSRLKKLRRTEEDTLILGKSYVARLRSQFQKIYPRPAWIDQLEAKLHDSESDRDSDSDDSSHSPNANAILSILKDTRDFSASKQLKLISASRLAISRLKDANVARPLKLGVQSLAFHSTHALLMTGGFDRTLRIYHVDGAANPLVTSLHLKDLPVSTCHFAPLSDKHHSGNLIFAGGRRRYMHKWDLDSGEVAKVSRMYGHEHTQRSFEYFKVLPLGTYVGLTGNSGWCNLLSARTGQWVRGFKIEGRIVDFEFSADEQVLVVVNAAGQVWEYALSVHDKVVQDQGIQDQGIQDQAPLQNQVLRRWDDNGGVGITKIKLGGPKSRWLAIGSNNGLVNIYDRTRFVEGTPFVPVRCVQNLVTTISSLAFTSDGQLLCVALRGKRDALRIVHLPSCTVYSNWPTSGTPLGKVTAAQFSPNNKMLAVGNEAGKVTLWRLEHY